jgi:hypothetical protein
MIPLVRPGHLLSVNEPDYWCGVLRLWITKVGSVQRRYDGDWLYLEGFSLRADGTQTSVGPRSALVRTSALRGALRRGGALS